MSAQPSHRKLLYFVLDGLGDEACHELDERTPLAAANVPHLDALARQGATFRLDLRDSSGNVSTDHGQFSLLGYDDEPLLPKRGPVEAAGIGLALKSGDVAFRANYATFDAHGHIVDRRAGRIREGAEALSRAIDGIDLGDGVTAMIRSGAEHRAALVLRGPGLSDAISDSDPMHTSDAPITPLPVVAFDSQDEPAVRTADKLSLYLSKVRPLLADHPVNIRRRARQMLCANGLLTRRPGRLVALPTLEERFGIRGIAIAGGCTVPGVMRLIGCETITVPEFTANADTDLRRKVARALQALQAAKHDMVMVHIKATDTLAHDRQPLAKARFLEQIDREIGVALKGLPADALLAVGADHSTSSATGDHIPAPPPALLHGRGVDPTGATAFNEMELERSGAEVLRGAAFFERVLAAMRGGDAYVIPG